MQPFTVSDLSLGPDNEMDDQANPSFIINGAQCGSPSEEQQEAYATSRSDDGDSSVTSDAADSKSLIETVALAIGTELSKVVGRAKVDQGDDKSLNMRVFTGNADEDVDEWFIKFEYMADAKGWNKDKMLKKIPCLLDKHAFTAYFAASDAIKKDYGSLKEHLCARFRPSNPFGYWRNQFRIRKQAIKESVISFAHGLQAIATKLKMYDSKNPVSDRELMEVFLIGLHPYYRKALIGSPEIKTFEQAVERARGLEEGYRSVNPETTEKFNRIGEPLLDATCILNADPKMEAELLGLSPSEVERLLSEARRKAQTKTIGDLFNETNPSLNAIDRAGKSQMETRLDRMERMLERIGTRNSYERFNKPRVSFQTPNRGGFNRGFSRGGRHGFVSSINTNGKRPREDDNMSCYNCGGKGHFARMCKSPKKDYGSRDAPARPQSLNSNRA